MQVLKQGPATGKGVAIVSFIILTRFIVHLCGKTLFHMAFSLEPNMLPPNPSLL